MTGQRQAHPCDPGLVAAGLAQGYDPPQHPVAGAVTGYRAKAAMPARPIRVSSNRAASGDSEPTTAGSTMVTFASSPDARNAHALIQGMGLWRPA